MYIPNDKLVHRTPFYLTPGLNPGVKSFRRQFKQVFAGRILIMQLLAPTFLLFALNVLDALLTIVWVRTGVATEGNQLMARLLDVGNGPFLIVKIAIGAVAALVLFRCGHRRVARYGLAVALAVYISLMGIHLFTGLSAFGYVSNTALHDLAEWPGQVLAMIC